MTSNPTTDHLTETKFYIQRPADEYDNCWYTHAVIEAVKTDASGLGLRVLAPTEFAGNWPTVRLNPGPYASWVETEGPARMLSREEWLGLIETLDILADPDAMAAIEEAEGERR